MIDTKVQFETMLTVARGTNVPMTGTRFKHCIEAVGLTQEAAGVFFGRHPRSGQNWATEAALIPFPVQACLEYMVAHGKKALRA